MKYIVEVGEPIPSNLDEVASKVAASFNISDAKAMALLRRAPGAMTKAVSEREADVVAGIFERAGLNVVKRQADEGGDGAGRSPRPAGHDNLGQDARPSQGAGAAHGNVPEHAPPPFEGADEAGLDDVPGFGGGREAADGFRAGPVAGRPEAPVEEAEPTGPSHPPRSGDEDVWSQPLGSTEHEPVDRFSTRDDFEERAADIGWDGDTWSAGGGEREAFGAGDTDPGVTGSAGEAGRGREGSAATAGAAGPGGAGVDEEEGIDLEVGTPPEEHGAADEPGAAPAEESAETEPAPDSRRRGRRQRPQPARAGRAPRQPRRREAAGRAAGRNAERGADDVRLRSGGIRRGIGWVGFLPPLLTLLAMGVAMLVTLVPQAKDQQASQAADAAGSQAAALEALTGGLPLTAQTLSGALTDLSNNAQASLRPNGVSLMVVTDANGAPLAGWYGPAETPAAMPPATRQAVTASALAAISGKAPATTTGLSGSLRSTWSSVEAMVGLGSESTVLRAAPVTSAGQAIGSVVVGVPPVSGRSTLVAAFETVLLVGVIPLLIGILMAMGLTGGLRRKVQYLLQAADRISRGDLEEPVSLRSRDELGQLARAIERMRVSLATLLEHRRRQR